MLYNARNFYSRRVTVETNVRSRTRDVNLDVPDETATAKSCRVKAKSSDDCL